MRMIKIILTVEANAELLNFTEKLKTASVKYLVNMVWCSFLLFAVNLILNLSNNYISISIQSGGSVKHSPFHQLAFKRANLVG